MRHRRQSLNPTSILHFIELPWDRPPSLFCAANIGVNVDRKHFLRTIGGAALVPLVSHSLTASREAAAAAAPVASCQFSPSVPEGPFYFDTKWVREEIAEGRPGIPIEYRLTVVNASCQPVANAAVDIAAMLASPISATINLFDTVKFLF